MKKYALSDLILDFDLYPRGSVDSQHAQMIAQAVESGAVMPPLVIDKASKRIVDGFHRWRAYRRLHGESFKIDCVEKSYNSDAELFEDAARYNVTHGRALTQHDKTHCLIRAKQLGIDPDAMAAALCITPERMGKLTSGRIGTLHAQPMALKRTISHMSGRALTDEQAYANKKLSGMNQQFYVNQIIMLIENDLLDADNADLMESLRHLRALLSDKMMEAA